MGRPNVSNKNNKFFFLIEKMTKFKNYYYFSKMT